MDSMRSLNTSLPGTSSSKQPEPPEQLLSAFKAAALSVTNLYKSAAANQAGARSEGYQNALDELLAFLDKEDIGLTDGEGWKIRRWATERLDGRDSTSNNIESDDEGEKTDRGSSPALPRTNSSTRVSPPVLNMKRNVSPVRSDQAPLPNIITPDDDTSNPSNPQTAFTFQSSHAYPHDSDIILADLESENARTSIPDSSAVSHVPVQASGLALTRPSRSKSNHSNRIGSKTTVSLGKGAGQKRKINFGDFFDIGSAGYGRESFGGGKRGKFI
ncbi:hypothetical protein K3495_g1495 [Podosphaera aphanis]|nr:hypothetical protein K3495_g1495 [Podosphaera aphanis]